MRFFLRCIINVTFCIVGLNASCTWIILFVCFFFSITFYPYQSTSDNYKLILRTLGGFMKNIDWGKVQIYYQKKKKKWHFCTQRILFSGFKSLVGNELNLGVYDLNFEISQKCVKFELKLELFFSKHSQ